MLLHCNIYAFASQYHNFLIPISLPSSFCSIFPSSHSASKAPLCQPHYRLKLVRNRNRVSAIFHYSLFTLHFSLKKNVTPILHSSFYILHLEKHNNPPIPTL